MSEYSPQIPRLWRVILSSVIACIMYAFIWLSSQFSEPPGFGWYVILLLLMAYITFESVRRSQEYLLQRIKAFNATLNRFLSVMGSIVIGTLTYTVQFYGFKWLDHFIAHSEPPYLQHMLMAALMGLVLSVVFALIQLGINWRQQYFESQLENERFKREIAQANLSILKHQLDPHFMFNNFNTLYYLIEEDGEMARNFLKNVSTIYRYILQNHDKSLISASEEYDMARQYLAVIEQRYAQHFTLIDETTASAFEQKSVPPLVLQQLIENAIKHNRIDEESPLKLTLSTADNYLTVTNSLNLKRPEITAKTGLRNIEKRYHYMTEQQIIIAKTQTEFQVSVPLIATHV